jgi:MerR family transcriptional regulator, light-induced transcriptional regulator
VADEGLTAGAAARSLGVAVTTLRTWHQRYGLGPSRHEAGRHRRYTRDDMGRLEVMVRLTAQGVPPSEAAAWARRIPVPAGVGPPPDGVEPGRDGGGRAIRTGRAGPAARGLARAAMRLDAHALRDILELTVATHGVVAAWEQVIMPVLIGIGERYEATRRLIEVEHLTSRTVTEVLAAVPRPTGTDPPAVLLAAADEEQHTLALEALAAALAEAGVPSRLYGARVPPRALGDAIARTGPAAVVIWSQLPPTADPEQLRRVLAAPHRPLLVAAAGPGWSPGELPAGVATLGGLTEAVTVVSAAAQVGHRTH